MTRIQGRAYQDWFAFQMSQRDRPLPKSHGLWCKSCQRSHPYNSTSSRDPKLGFTYEWRNSKLVVMWTCPRTNTVLGELNG